MANAKRRSTRPQQYNLQWPPTPSQWEAVNEMFQTLFKQAWETREIQAVSDAVGSVFTASASVPGLDGLDGEDSYVPGPIGLQGAVGPAGPSGSGTGSGAFLPYFEDGRLEDWNCFGPYTPLDELAVSAFNSAVQTLTTGIYAVLTFDSEEFDTANLHSTAVNTSRITIPTGGDGLYLYSFGVTFNVNAFGAVGQRLAIIKKNGTTYIGPYALVDASSGTYSIVTNATGLLRLVAGDYLELIAQQDSGANMDVGFASPYAASRLQVRRVAR